MAVQQVSGVTELRFTASGYIRTITDENTVQMRIMLPWAQPRDNRIHRRSIGTPQNDVAERTPLLMAFIPPTLCF